MSLHGRKINLLKHRAGIEKHSATLLELGRNKVATTMALIVKDSLNHSSRGTLPFLLTHVLFHYGLSKSIDILIWI